MDTTEELPDILLFVSDQHHGLYAGYAGHPVVQTPNLDHLAADGTVCETVYTPCPLCVPARSSFLAGQLPSGTGVYGNGHWLSTDQATFLHSLAARGYETVLCGRMHFSGPDQRHGFSKRIFGDITSVYPGGGMNSGFFQGKFSMKGCADLAGGGDSPVLAYDRAVCDAAIEYLQQQHEKPQCIVVGTYGPHFPYVAPEKFFKLYEDQVSPPASWSAEWADPNPLVDAKRQRTRISPLSGEEQPVDAEVVSAIQAAYLGMITEQDRLVGEVREQWEEYLENKGGEGIFIYTSDHGDTCGEHGIFGKQTFYEGSVRVPLLFEGCGIPAGGRLTSPVSLLDVGPTCCEIAGAELPPEPDGVSIWENLRHQQALSERPVISEWTQLFDGEFVPGRMVRYGNWKLMCFHSSQIPDLLFDVVNDPDELDNQASQREDVLAELKPLLEEGWEPERIAADYSAKGPHYALISKAYREMGPEEPEIEKWRIPDEFQTPPNAMR